MFLPQQGRKAQALAAHPSPAPAPKKRGKKRPQKASKHGAATPNDAHNEL